MLGKTRGQFVVGLVMIGSVTFRGGLETTAAGVVAPSRPRPSPSVTADQSLHAPFDQLLRAFVNDGRVDYASLKSHEATLDAYRAALARTDPSRLPRDERMALWINAYNAFTIKLILRRYPGITSIKDIPRRWDTREWTVGGRRYSLAGIEHEILRKEFREPRIHFAIVCASKSCPSLASEAYVGDRIDEQLTQAARTFLADPNKGFRARREKGVLYGYNNNVYLSKVFKWFGEDFERQSGSVLNAIMPYLPASDQAFLNQHRNNLSIRYMGYDWTLNSSEDEPV